MNAAGIDIGTEEVYVAVPPDRDEQSVRLYPTFTADLYRLADWLQRCGIETVAMEATGVYWIPLYDHTTRIARMLGVLRMISHPLTAEETFRSRFLGAMRSSGIKQAKAEEFYSMLLDTLKQGPAADWTPFVNAFRKAIQPNTKLLYGETIANPFGNVFPIEEVAKIAEESRIPLMIDNTAATPYLCRPFEWGAHIITHSTSKYIGGHGATIGGVIVDSGRFNWAGSERHKNFNTPDPSYHDVVYALDFGPLAFISKARAGILRDLDTCQSPFNSWLFIQGLETLSLRMDRHVKNAQAAAEFLSDHPKVNRVTYAGLPNHRDHERAKKYLPKGPSAVLGFGVKGDVRQAQSSSTA